MKLKTLFHSNVFQDKLFRFALRILNDEQAAQDALQDVLEKMWKKKEQVQGHDNVEALAMKMMKDLCFDNIKHQQMKTEKHAHLQQVSIVQLIEYEHKDLHTITTDLMQRLPEKQKLVIHLRDVEGYDFKEMEALLDMDIKAMRMNLSRARKTIREQLIKIMNHGV